MTTWSCSTCTKRRRGLTKSGRAIRRSCHPKFRSETPDLSTKPYPQSKLTLIHSKTCIIQDTSNRIRRCSICSQLIPITRCLLSLKPRARPTHASAGRPSMLTWVAFPSLRQTPRPTSSKRYKKKSRSNTRSFCVTRSNNK